MEIKTCEEYVLNELEKSESLVADLTKSLNAATDEISFRNVRIQTLESDVKFLLSLFRPRDHQTLGTEYELKKTLYIPEWDPEGDTATKCRKFDDLYKTFMPEEEGE